MEAKEKLTWDGMGYEEQEYNKPIGKTIFNLVIDSGDDDDEREGEYYTLKDALNDREDDYEKITYTIFFDTDKPPFAYEFGWVNSKGEMVATWRAGWNLK